MLLLTIRLAPQVRMLRRKFVRALKSGVVGEWYERCCRRKAAMLKVKRSTERMAKVKQGIALVLWRQ
eukprot:7241034-Pyramimonas_sp.AAC.1